MKLSRIVIVLGMFLVGFSMVMAQDECFLLKFNFSEWKKYTSSVLQKNEILKEPELKKSYDLMNTYYFDKGNCPIQQDYIPEKRYPNSPFLLDYLVNIGFRKLDAIDSQLYPQLSPDPVGLEWRSELKELLEKQSPSATPGEIKSLYDSYWKVENGTLLRKYKKVCKEAFDIWQALVAPKRPDSMDTLTQIVFDNFSLRCEELVLKRAHQEKAFIEAQMQQQWEYVVKEQTEKYLVEYFEQQRLENLLKKVHKLVGIWW